MLNDCISQNECKTISFASSLGDNYEEQHLLQDATSPPCAPSARACFWLLSWSVDWSLRTNRMIFANSPFDSMRFLCMGSDHRQVHRSKTTTFDKLTIRHPVMFYDTKEGLNYHLHNFIITRFQFVWLSMAICFDRNGRLQAICSYKNVNKLQLR